MDGVDNRKRGDVWTGAEKVENATRVGGIAGGLAITLRQKMAGGINPILVGYSQVVEWGVVSACGRMD